MPQAWQDMQFWDWGLDSNCTLLAGAGEAGAPYMGKKNNQLIINWCQEPNQSPVPANKQLSAQWV